MKYGINSKAPGPEDYNKRISKLREIMAEAKIGAAFITPSPNLQYFTGLKIAQNDRLKALLIPVDGPMAFITPGFEAPSYTDLSIRSDLIAWEEDEDPFIAAAAFLNDKIKWRRIALEPSVYFESAWKLMDAGAGKFSLEQGRPALDRVRRSKDKLELMIMEEAVDITHEALEMTWSTIQDGMTETGIAAIVNESFAQLNPESGGECLVQIGASAALPHGAPGEKVLKDGDVLLIDCGTDIHGYHSDITRTVVFGKASEKIRHVYDIVKRAQEAGVAMLKEGNSMEAVDKAARKVIEDAGFGRYFMHRLGHGIGLEGHESPYLVKGDQSLLRKGDTVTVEPGIYLQGEFGIRIEDIACVTKAGCSIIGERPTSLREIN